MSLPALLGDINLDISIPGKLISNGKTVGESIRLSYGNERLKVSFVPEQSELPVNLAARITFNRGVLCLIGVETNRNVSYTANYIIMSKKLSVNVNGRIVERRIRNIAEILNVVTSLILTSVPRQ